MKCRVERQFEREVIDFTSHEVGLWEGWAVQQLSSRETTGITCPSKKEIERNQTTSYDQKKRLGIIQHDLINATCLKYLEEIFQSLVHLLSNSHSDFDELNLIPQTSTIATLAQTKNVVSTSTYQRPKKKGETYKRKDPCRPWSM